jgi:hypothetical protein
MPPFLPLLNVGCPATLLDIVGSQVFNRHLDNVESVRCRWIELPAADTAKISGGRL